MPLGYDEEGLAVFFSESMARTFTLERTPSRAPGRKWHTRICSACELASFLLVAYPPIEWVLLDPPGHLIEGDPPLNLICYESFVDYLLG
jgi:hypothetical protein